MGSRELHGRSDRSARSRGAVSNLETPGDFERLLAQPRKPRVPSQGLGDASTSMELDEASGCPVTSPLEADASPVAAPVSLGSPAIQERLPFVPRIVGAKHFFRYTHLAILLAALPFGLIRLQVTFPEATPVQACLLGAVMWAFLLFTLEIQLIPAWIAGWFLYSRFELFWTPWNWWKTSVFVVVVCVLIAGALYVAYAVAVSPQVIGI